MYGYVHTHHMYVLIYVRNISGMPCMHPSIQAYYTYVRTVVSKKKLTFHNRNNVVVPWEKGKTSINQT